MHCLNHLALFLFLTAVRGPLYNKLLTSQPQAGKTSRDICIQQRNIFCIPCCQWPHQQQLLLQEREQLPALNARTPGGMLSWGHGPRLSQESGLKAVSPLLWAGSILSFSTLTRAGWSGQDQAFHGPQPPLTLQLQPLCLWDHLPKPHFLAPHSQHRTQNAKHEGHLQCCTKLGLQLHSRNRSRYLVSVKQ